MVKKYLFRMFSVILILGTVEVILFAVFKKFSLPVLYGTLLGCAYDIVQLLSITLSLNESLDKGKKGATGYMTSSYFIRLVLAGAVVFTAIKLPNIFNLWATVIPLFFTKVSAYIAQYTLKGEKHDGC